MVAGPLRDYHQLTLALVKRLAFGRVQLLSKYRRLGGQLQPNYWVLSPVGVYAECAA